MTNVDYVLMSEQWSGHKAQTVYEYFEKSNRFEWMILPSGECVYQQIVFYRKLIQMGGDLRYVEKRVANVSEDADEETQKIWKL